MPRHRRQCGSTGSPQPAISASAWECHDRSAGADQLIGVRRQASLLHQGRVQIPHGPCGGVPRIGEERQRLCLTFAIGTLEGGARQIHLAAHFNPLPGTIAKRQRQRPNGADVARHVLAPDTVAARGPSHELSILVGQGNAQAVDLELGHIGDGLIADLSASRASSDPASYAPVGPSRPREARPLPHALVERTQLFIRVDVVQAEHGRAMLDGLEPLDRTSRDALGRGIRRDEIGVLRLEALQFVEQAIEGRVIDLGIVVDVVALLVMANRLTKRQHPRDDVRGRRGHCCPQG
jgi:hypothetical protein